MSDNDDNQPHEPTPLEEITLQNAIRMANMAQPDRTYASIYKKFVKWVKDKLDIVDPPFITPTTVDHYFSEEVVKNTGCKQTLMKIVSALDWYVKKKEIVPRMMLKRNNVMFEEITQVKGRDAVETAINVALLNSQNEGKTSTVDPHKGLKDLITPDQLERCMTTIYNENDWGNLAIHFLYGQNGAIRDHSNRNLVYCDLKLSTTFVPEAGHAALLVILRKGVFHKDRHDKDKQVAYWRHRSYKLCSLFGTAAYLICHLSKNRDIDFFRPDKKKRAKWWDVPLTAWDNYDSKYCVQFVPN